MSNSSFANEDVMEDYLSALLTDEAVAEEPVNRDSVARLLEKVDEKPSVKPTSKPADAIEVAKTEQVKATTPVADVQAKVKAPATPVADIPPAVAEALPDLVIPETPASGKDQLEQLKEESFQALFFEVAGLTLAVPLIHLGGIHNMEETSQIFGKPDWFTGIMLYREEKLNTVDTARWVMPEKYNEKLAQSLDYKYLIMLGESAWGLSCENLINTVTLSPDDIKWREERGKRPWLAGMVKEKMCALLDIEQLINMLDNGLTSNEQ